MLFYWNKTKQNLQSKRREDQCLSTTCTKCLKKKETDSQSKDLGR